MLNFIIILPFIIITNIVLYRHHKQSLKLKRFKDGLYAHIQNLSEIQSEVHVHESMWDYWKKIETEIDSLNTLR